MPVVATATMGAIALLACFIPLDVLLTATGSTVAFSYLFIALAALVNTVARPREGGVPDAAFPLPPIVAIIVIAGIILSAVLDPAQWLSLAIALGIVAAGFLYYYAYLRPRSGTHLVLLDAEDER